MKRFLAIAALALSGASASLSPASAQFFGSPSPPAVGDIPPANAGGQAQQQGYFLRDWFKAGRISERPPSAWDGPFRNPEGPSNPGGVGAGTGGGGSGSGSGGSW